MRRPARMRRPVVVLAGLLALAAALPLGGTSAVERIENDSLDARFAVRGTQPVQGIAVVAIDEKTFSEETLTWPFRRRLHAQMVDSLRRAGVRQIVYDVQFTEPSGRPADDLALYDAVARMPGTVLATGESDARGRTRVLGGDTSLAAIGAEAASSTFPGDDGGVIRRYSRGNTGLESLATATARRVGRPAPADGSGEDGTALIDYRGIPGTIPTYSFTDVLRGRVGAAALRGRIVVVGASAPVLQDVHATSAPGSRLMSGPEIQASAIWTAVHGNPLRRVPGWAALLIAAGLGLLGPLAVRALGPLRGAAAAVLAGAIYAAGTQVAFAHGTVLPVAEPLLALLAALVAAGTAAVAAEIAARARLSRYSAELEDAVRARTAELAEAQLEVVLRLARAAELRDDDTGEHIERMSGLCREVALELGWTATEAELLQHASVLHDVGKIGVPDEILRKPGRLTDAEFAVMRHHVVEGAHLLSGSSSRLLVLAETVARTHHERWDGGGYPARMAGEAIPLAGRIAAVCDVFDALVSERPYKQAWTVEEACAEVTRERGAHFDPVVADALLAVIARRLAVAERAPALVAV